MGFQSLNKLFLDRVEDNLDKPFLWSKINKEWNFYILRTHLRFAAYFIYLNKTVLKRSKFFSAIPVPLTTACKGSSAT